MTQATTKSPFRSALASVPTYKAGKQPAATSGLTPYKLSSNEHYLPPLPGILETLAEPINPANYPDPSATALISALSDYLQVPNDHITVGAGGSEMLTAISHVTLEAGTEVVYPSPSFELYAQAAALNGATQQPMNIPAESNHDAPAMPNVTTDDTRWLLLCSPTNPTRPTNSKTEHDEFMPKVTSAVLDVLDEAYWEFMTELAAGNGLSALND